MSNSIMALLMPLIIGSVALASGLENTSEYSAEPEPPAPPKTALIRVDIKWTQERIQEEVETQAKRYDVSASLMWKIIKCESTDPKTKLASTTIQSTYYKDGVREESYGLSQINLPAHPNVTYKQAIDPQFAIEFLAKNVGRNPRMWSCYEKVI